MYIIFRDWFLSCLHVTGCITLRYFYLYVIFLILLEYLYLYVNDIIVSECSHSTDVESTDGFSHNLVWISCSFQFPNSHKANMVIVRISEVWTSETTAVLAWSPKISCVTIFLKMFIFLLCFLANVKQQHGGCTKIIFNFPFPSLITHWDYARDILNECGS
jgi:hypothetical protein